MTRRPARTLSTDTRLEISAVEVRRSVIWAPVELGIMDTIS